MSLILRLATADDLPFLKALMMRSIAELQSAFLTPEQIEASFELMGLDTQLVADGTYFVVRTQNFGTADQPNKPARVTMQVAALVAPAMLAEIEVQAVRRRGIACKSARSIALKRPSRSMGLVEI